MPDLLDRIHSELHHRLEETRAAVLEYEQLQTALRALGDARAPQPTSTNARQPPSAPPVPPKTGASKPAAPARSAARKRAARGANRNAVLRALGERPGASVSELATASGVAKNILYGVLRALVQQGEAQKRELPSGRTGYALSNPSETADATPAETQAAAVTTPDASPAPPPRPVTTRRSARRS
jgi:hypothetical protein